MSKEKLIKFVWSAWMGFALGVIIGLTFSVLHPLEVTKNIYLPVKECIVLRKQCTTSGLCVTLETYNCEDINY